LDIAEQIRNMITATEFERMEILGRIERYLRRTGTPPTRFGRNVANDPRLVLDMRRGRCPGASMQARIEAALRVEDAR
jgi:hypothetical protein